MTGPYSWTVTAQDSEGRRGLRLSTLYMGASRWRRVWPYHAQAEDVARTILTVRTSSGGFSFRVSDLEQGPILAPEYGFFVRAIGEPEGGDASRADQPSAAVGAAVFAGICAPRRAAEFSRRAPRKNLKTIRQRVREHAGAELGRRRRRTPRR